jgi:hypothetical protein
VDFKEFRLGIDIMEKWGIIVINPETEYIKITKLFNGKVSFN